MPFTIIAGELHIHDPVSPRRGPEPDGDTIRFRPDDPELLQTLYRTAGLGPTFTAQGMVNLRLEGVDTLELHYENSHQELAGAVAARDALLQFLGFGAIAYIPESPFKVATVEHHPRRAHIFARSIDRYGRIICFLVRGDSPEPDGFELHLTADRIDSSANATLLRRGLAFPAFYSSLPVDLREHLSGIATAARADGRGVWPRNTATPTRSAHLATLADAEAIVLWPKLFRRLAAYFSDGFTGLAGFVAWLRDGHDDRLILPHRELGNMHDIVDITRDDIRLKYEPETLVLVDDPVPEPPPLPPGPPARANDIRIIAAVPNPFGSDRGRETITILNATPADIDLAGWGLVDRSGTRLPLSGRLTSGETRRLKVSRGLQLTNTGDRIDLQSAEGNLIDRATYSETESAREGWSILFSRLV